MKLYSQGVLIFGFTDYRDAKHAYANAQQDNPAWRLVRLSPKAHALNSEESYVLGQRNIAYVSDFEGQIVLPSPHRIGMVFQEPRLLPWRSVAQNLRLGGSPSENDLAEIVAALRLSKHLDHFPGELSLGLARRAAIARAFVVKPDLLLLDEPFVSLDAALATQLREELLALVLKRKATTLIVTHDLEEAISLADRIIVLSAAPGRILADRTIAAPREALTEGRAAKMKEEIRSLTANASS